MHTKKKIFSAFLIFALVLTTVFAGTGSVFANDIKLDGTFLKGASYEDASLMKAADDTSTLTPIKAVSLNSSTAANSFTTQEYDNRGIYYPIEIPSAGNFVISVLAVGDTYVSLYDGLDANAACIGSGLIPGAQTENDIKTFSVQVKQAGVYYLVFQSASSYNKAQSIFMVNYAAANKSGSTTTLSSGKTRYASVSGTGNRYFKITTSGTRYLTVQFPWGDGGTNRSYKVKLMDSKKKNNLFKGTVTVNANKNYVTYAGVPKGTYYVAVSTATDTCYSLKVTSKSVTEKSGSTRSKANRIYKGSVRNGIITATQTSSSGDWYKIVLTASQKVSLQVKTKSGGYSGGIKMSVYSGSKTKPFGIAEHYYGEPDGVWDLSTEYNGGRLQKGTYYIKIQKYGSSSGYYQLKWL